MNAKLLIPLAIAFVVGAVWFFTRRTKTTRIDSSGVLFVRSRASPLFLPWSEIAGFGIASVCLIEGGLHQPGFTQCVGVRLESVSPKKESKACRDNRRLSDYDMLFSPDSDVSLADFVAHLENEKAKFKKGYQPPEPTAQSVTDCAFARSAPASAVAHLKRSAKR